MGSTDSLHQACVLVVEHDQMVRDVICRMLQDDYEVVGVRTVSAALSMLDHQPISVVLVDYYLPGEFQEAIALRAGLFKVPLVRMSSDPNELVYFGGIFHTMLEKPFTAQEVLDALAEALTGNEPTRWGRRPGQDYQKSAAMEEDI
jgi:CheY-like chemotaxis protein